MQVARPDDKGLKALLDKFVCVRNVQGNGAGLALFQFDYDLTFAAFFLNADRRICGCYGTLPGPQAEAQGVNMKGFARALKLEPKSAAHKAGLHVGDDIVRLAGQPILSIADVQWVLHSASDPTTIEAVVRRSDKELRLELALVEGFRRPERLSFRMLGGHSGLARISRMGLGVRLRELSFEECFDLDIDPLALAVTPDTDAGRRGRRMRGRRGGRGVARVDLRPGDVVVAFDGITKQMSETDILAHCLQKRTAGDQVPIVVLRGGKRVKLTPTLPR